MLFKGFTDLGKYTRINQKNQRGDHALVFLFQPFCSKWVQTVGTFLSKGCANGRVLNKLILECIILMETADFYVDVVTIDRASWNRSRWKLFGIEGSNSCCRHPYSIDSPLRKLWFCSDFSHWSFWETFWDSFRSWWRNQKFWIKKWPQIDPPQSKVLLKNVSGLSGKPLNYNLWFPI